MLKIAVVCIVLALCGSMAHGAPIAGGVKADDECSVCETIMTEINTLAANVTYDQVKTWIDDICNALPPSSQGNCTKFAKLYSFIIFEAIKGKIPPKEACKLAGFCKNSTVEFSGSFNGLKMSQKHLERAQEIFASLRDDIVHPKVGLKAINSLVKSAGAAFKASPPMHLFNSLRQSVRNGGMFRQQ